MKTIAARILLPMLALTLVVQAVHAQQPLFIYTMRDNGALLVNGTTLEKAPSLYDPANQDAPHGEERYQDLAVAGADRWLLRVDGRVQKNGTKLHELPFELFGNAPFWFRMHVDALGTVYAVRTDGMTVCNGQVLATFEGVPFVDLTSVPAGTEGAQPDVFVLRVDGSIFRPDSPTSPGLKLEFDRDPDHPEPDGADITTQWLHLVYDEVTQRLFAMRADGVVMSLDPADFAPVTESPGDGAAGLSNGLLQAVLPFNFTANNIYTDFEMSPAEVVPPGAAQGSASEVWYALRTDGKVFSSTLPSPTPELEETWDWIVDLPGDGVSQSPYVDMSALAGEGEFWSMQFNGSVYQATNTDELFDVKSGSLSRIAVSHESPDGVKFKNHLPTAAIYKTKLVAGQAADIPVLLADTDKATEDLVVTFRADKSKLPEGVEPADLYDDAIRTITFPGAPAKASFKFVIEVDDGSGKPPKRFSYPIKVLPADETVEKNKTPIGTSIKTLVAFTDQTLVFPLVVTDLDGDALSVEPVDLKGDDIFDEQFGAEFDAETNTVSWTPAFEHLGKHVAVFLITDDGDPSRSRKLKLKIVVASQLVFDGEG